MFRRRVRLLLESLEGRTVPAFLPALNSAAGFSPTALAVGDFNEDGLTDLGVSNLGGEVVLLRGLGDGTFAAPQARLTGPNARYVVTADFNADQHLDLAVICRPSMFEPGEVTLLRGNGDGTFQEAQQFATGVGPSGATVGDFNNDGRLDLVVINYNGGGISYLSNDGANGFLPAVTTSVGGGGPVSGAAADFNADGNLDLVVARRQGGNVAMIHGRGDGTFAPPINYAAGSQAFAVAVGHLNGDATPDVVVAHRRAGANVTVFKGTVKGGLKMPPTTYPGGVDAWSADLGDFDGDGVADVAIANNGGGSLSVFRNNGDATLQPALNFPAGNNSFAVAVGNFNDDLLLDVAVANRFGNTVSVYLNDGDWGGFAGGGPRGDTAAVVATLLADAVPRRR